MPLHDKDSVRDNLDDELYASTDLSVAMPKYKFPETEHDPRHAYAVVHDELMLDGNSRQNLATFCQTRAEPEVHQLMDECMDKNMIDKDELSADRRERGTLRTHARRSMEFAGGRQHDRLLDHGLQRSRHARRHGVSRNLGSLLVEDMQRAIDYFKQHPVHTRMTADEASGFHH
jgi:hypothetical protein